MTSAVWRFAHLALAIFSFVFLLVASVTGVILAVDAVNEKIPTYRVDGFNEITLAQSLPVLREVYPEALELSIDHNQFVTLEGFNDQGDDFKSVIHPLTGKVLGTPAVKTDFIQWITALHRSLFLHETGRFIVGFISFLLLLIAFSGTVLIVKRQHGIRSFFSKINRDSFARYFHVVSGRLLLIPVIIIALSGTYLFLIRFNVIPKPINEPDEIVNYEGEKIPLSDFPIFKQTRLADVVKVEFPFSDDSDEFFKVKLKDKEITVNQLTGKVLAENKYPVTAVLETLSLDLHTGRTNAVWAIILGIASLNILFFIYSGFTITFKRKSVKIRNKFKPEIAETVLLVGSENGSTLHFANNVHKQFLAGGIKSYLANMNDYTIFPHAKKIIIFTSTYGLGDPPSNAHLFKKRVQQYQQKQEIQFSVVGFGSKSYQDFCAFALQTNKLLAQQSWAKPIMPLHTVNEKSIEEFILWVKQYNEQTNSFLATTAALYAEKQQKLTTFTVQNKTTVNEKDAVFQLTLLTNKKVQSGDLLAVYPANDTRERLYSIAKINGKIQLVIKLHESGLGSQYLYRQIPNNTVKGRIVKNKSFYFPKKAPAVMMIANGTGIAPFLGMINENNTKTKVHLYCGFKYNNSTVDSYRIFADTQIKKGSLQQFQTAFSREENRLYVMNLIEKDAELFSQVLASGGVVMICGSLVMQKDVEKVLNNICYNLLDKPLSFFKNNKQLLTDCY